MDFPRCRGPIVHCEPSRTARRCSPILAPLPPPPPPSLKPNFAPCTYARLTRVFEFREYVLLQTERAFQKQANVFVARTKAVRKGRGLRWVKSVGLGFKTPKAALTGTYIDKKCPFVGNVSIRGRILKGVVISTKMDRTIVIRRDYLHYIKKYRRYEKRHSTLSAHCSPAFRVKEGDVVTVGQCRPLAKTVRFNVLKVEPVTDANAQASKKAFRVF